MIKRSTDGAVQAAVGADAAWPAPSRQREVTAIHRADRLPRHLGPDAWNAILPSRQALPGLQERIDCDVAIVGAGFAGLSAARRLLQLDPGLRVVILEAGRIAEGASGRNSGFMIDLPHDLTSRDYAGQERSRDRQVTDLNRSAIEFAAQSVAEFDIDPAWFERAGKVNGAASAESERRNASYAAHLDALGEPYELLDARSMTDLTGSRYYRSGLYTPGTVMLQPAGFVRGLAAGLAARARLFENSPVTSLERVGSDWCASTAGGRVMAHRILLANNGHLESFGFRRRQLMHVFLFACMTRELSRAEITALGGRSRWGLTPSDPMGTTVRRIDAGQGGERIVTRTCADFRPEMQTTQKQLARAAQVMRRKFEERFPQIGNVEMEHLWAGHLCLSLNGVSVTGEIETGLFAACCQNGLGTTRGVLSGIAAAELASGTSSKLSRFFTSEAQPARLPPEPLASSAANGYLRWKEWRARAE